MSKLGCVPIEWVPSTKRSLLYPRGPVCRRPVSTAPADGWQGDNSSGEAALVARPHTAPEPQYAHSCASRTACPYAHTVSILETRGCLGPTANAGNCEFIYHIVSSADRV